MSEGVLHLFDLLTWRLARALPGMRPGGHRGTLRGAGETFADLAPLIAHPDPRRIDVRRSLLDPFGTTFVRRFETRTDLTLHVLLDASASLGTGASSDRLGLAALLAAGFAEAAWRGGDWYALTATAGEDVVDEIQPARRRQLGAELLERIGALWPGGEGVVGLERAAMALPASRILVVLISDFEYSADELRRILAALEPRPVLPIWLRDGGLEAPAGRLGVAEIRDPESGMRRTVLTTRKWAAQQAQAAARHRARLRSTFAEHDLAPIEIRDQLDVGALAAALEEVPL